MEAKKPAVQTLPVLPLRNLVLFPGVVLPVDVGRSGSLKLVEDVVKRQPARVMIATSERDRLTEQVTALVRKGAKIPAQVVIRPESRLVEDLAIDSLDLVSLVLQVQDHFDVVFDEDAVPNLCRVADLVEYLAAGREGMAASSGEGMVRNGGRPYGMRGDAGGDGMVRNGGPYGSRGDAGRLSEAAGRAVVE